MKLFDSQSAPNPRRVRIVAAEKGISVDTEQVDINDKANLDPDFLAMNPLGKVPVLELDDGQFISESLAICRYFEVIQPEPALFGQSPEEKARIEMWIYRVEFDLVQRIFSCFQNTHDYMATRIQQVPEYGAVARDWAVGFLDILEVQLSSNEFIAGNAISMADISAFCAIDFGRVVKFRPGKEHQSVGRWLEAIASRPSAAA